MKQYVFALLFLLSSSFLAAQNDDMMSTMPPPPPPPMEEIVTKKCTDSKEELCTRKEIHKAVYKFLRRAEKKQLIANAKKDTIKILTILSIDKDKKIVPKKSSLKFFGKNTEELSKKVNERISKIRVRAQAPTETSHAQFFGYLCFKVDKEKKKLIPLYDYIPPQPEFRIIDTPPTFPGCEVFESKVEQKLCMSKKIQQHVARKFNSDLASDLDLTGIIRIYVTFQISKDGNIEKIRARAPHPRLEEEAINVVKKLPRMIPGKVDDKPVAVMYSLPIVFKVAE